MLFNATYEENFRESILMLLQHGGSCTTPRNIECSECIMMKLYPYREYYGCKISRNSRVSLLKERLPYLVNANYITEEDLFEVML